MRGLPPMSERTLTMAYHHALEQNADKIAHIGDGQQLTFAESFARVTRIGHGLASAGVRRAEPVALLLDNSIDCMHVWSGIGLSGRIEVPVNTANKGYFLSHILNDSQSSVAIIEASYADRLTRVAEDLTHLKTVFVRGEDGDLDGLRLHLDVRPFEELLSENTATHSPVTAADLIGYMYTSGTTGPSKGVLTSHGHAYTYSSRADMDRPRESDRYLITLPMFHLAGQWYGAYQALIHQLTSVIEPGFSVSRFWPVVREHGITMTIMLGAMAEILQQQPPQPDDADNPLEVAVMAPLASDVAGFCQRFGIEANAVYGMSEIGVVLAGAAEMLKPGEAGQLREGYDLRIVNPDGTDVVPGEVGELLVRPEDPLMVLSGYHNLPEKTAETIVDGWVHTGDALRMDEDWHYFFADRIKDALRRRGENISSFEVEKVINGFPAVLESAVVAVPSDMTEDDIKAVVVAREGMPIDPVELTEYLIDRMPYFMVPRYIELVDELPKTPTQKISKHLLRDRGVGDGVWDREAAGIVVRRDGSRSQSVARN